MNSKILLILSLCLNVGLVVGYVAKSGPAGGEAPPTPANVTASKPGAPVIRKVTTVVTNELIKTVDWHAVESEDYKKYIANLRAIGCPEETIRDIITADVNKLFESRRKALAGPKKKFEFWKPGALMGAAIDPERTEKERALNKEKRDLLTDLLGSAPDDKPDLLASTATQLEAMFDFLPPEKRSKVFELMQDMQAKMQKSMKGGAPDPEDIRKLMKESETTLAGVLSPEEMTDYNLRFSMTANIMRMQLVGFEPTEQEFLDLFKKRKAYDDEFGMAGMMGMNLKGEEKEKQQAAQKALDEQVKAQLGDDRYQDYKRSQDFAYQAMFRVADREGLGKEAAVKAYDMKKIAEDQANKIRRDNSLSSDQRTAALQGIRNETESSMKQVLGDKGFKSYQNQPGAYWLKSISPDPKE